MAILVAGFVGRFVAATGNAEHRHSFRFMLAEMDGQSEARCAEEYSEGEDDMKHFAGQYNDLDKNKQR